VTDTDTYAAGAGPRPPAATVTRSYPALRTIAALVLREMSTRFGRTPGGYIWAVLQPLASILLLALAFSFIALNPALGTSFVLFKATGMLVFQMFRAPSRTVGVSINYSRALLAYPGVTWADAVIARFLLNSMVMIVVSMIILTGVVLVEGLNLILNWPMIIGSMVMTSALAFGFGVFNAFMSERFEVYDNLWNIVTAPLMIASGVLFLFDDLPQFAQEILWYNPLIHTVGMMRAGFYSVYQPQYVSLLYVLICALVPMVMGLVLMRRYHRELLMR